MDRKELNTAKWGDVDQTQDTEHFVGYLDKVSAIEAVQAYKRRTYNLMKMKEGHAVLDIGCGAGDDVLKLAEMVGSSGRAVGIDNSETMIGVARQRSEALDLPVEFRVGDIYHLDEEDNIFDSCRADRIFQHLKDPQQALTEMIRVTRPGGRVVIFDVDWETLLIDAPDVAVTRKVANLICDDTANGWAGRQLFRYGKQAGLHELVVVPETAIIFEYALADHILQLSIAAETLQEAGELSASQVIDWVNALKHSDETGQFFCSVTSYTVCGRK